MMGTGGAEAGVMAAAFAGLVIAVATHVAIALGLTTWARSVARRRTGRGWRLASWIPLLALGTSSFGLIGTVLGLWIAFRSVADADPASRATTLAEGISEAMNATAFGVGSSWLLFLLSAVTSGVGMATAGSGASARDAP